MLPFNDPFAPNSSPHNTSTTTTTMSEPTAPQQHSLSSQSTTTTGGNGDAFSNREAASENMYIRQKEMDMYVDFFFLPSIWFFWLLLLVLVWLLFVVFWFFIFSLLVKSVGRAVRRARSEDVCASC